MTERFTARDGLMGLAAAAVTAAVTIPAFLWMTQEVRLGAVFVIGIIALLRRRQSRA